MRSFAHTFIPLSIWTSLISQAVAATPAVAEMPQVGSNSSSFGGALWFTFVCLMLAAGLFVLLAWVIKKNKYTASASANLQVLLQHPIGQNQHILIVKVLDRVLVLGQTTQQVSLLTELEPEEVAQIVQQTSKQNSQQNSPIENITSSFSQLLKGKLK